MVNQGKLGLLSTVQKFRLYRKFYKESSYEDIQKLCQPAMDAYFKSRRIYHDIVDMHTYTRAFHNSYRHEYASRKMAPKPQISPSPTPSNSQTETPSPTPTPTETVETVTVLLSNYQGQDVSLVVPMLTDIGLEVEPIAGTSLPADDPRISQVYDISPLGSLPIGTTVQVYYYQQVFDENTLPNQ